MKRTLIPAVATLMVLVALDRVPYGHYMVLRLGLCVACVYYVTQAGPGLAVGHCFALGGLAVLYNPVIPVHLGSKSLWTMINIATVVYFWFLETRRSPPPLKGGPGSGQ
ncbi:MAG: hypothetical protein HY235_30445 [Acidobacteria bacterium]|nr:hypothetical protein [Acidobacteriota bacterium]